LQSHIFKNMNKKCRTFQCAVNIFPLSCIFSPDPSQPQNVRLGWLKLTIHQGIGIYFPWFSKLVKSMKKP
jgi:hypothetical protein